MNRYLYLKNPWWQGKLFDSGILRPTYVKAIVGDIDTKFIQILTGLRRVGKSTITMQVIKHLLDSGTKKSQILNFSIEDPLLSKTPIIEIINEFRAEFNLKSNTKIFVFIDEIQFRENWEQEIKSIYDSENIKFILTGSSALLLSEKLSYLTGRYLKYQIFPLDFVEYLSFKSVFPNKNDDFLIQKQLENYLIEGGMPEYVKSKTDRYLETTVESILFKDLVSKFELRNPSILTDLIYLLSDRIGTPMSSLKLARLLEINKDTILTYIEYLNKTFITSELANFSYTRNKAIYNPGKIYFEDTGIANKYSSKTNLGFSAENVLYNQLSRNIKKITRSKIGYWYENLSEIDFVVSANNKVILVESKWVDDINAIDFKPLKLAVKDFKKIDNVYYVTRSVDEKIVIDGITVVCVPLWKFLLKGLEL